jgi:hypothetical protein
VPAGTELGVTVKDREPPAFRDPLPKLRGFDSQWKRTETDVSWVSFDPRLFREITKTWATPDVTIGGLKVNVVSAHQWLAIAGGAARGNPARRARARASAMARIGIGGKRAWPT